MESFLIGLGLVILITIILVIILIVFSRKKDPVSKTNSKEKKSDPEHKEEKKPTEEKKPEAEHKEEKSKSDHGHDDHGHTKEKSSAAPMNFWSFLWKLILTSITLVLLYMIFFVWKPWSNERILTLKPHEEKRYEIPFGKTVHIEDGPYEYRDKNTTIGLNGMDDLKRGDDENWFILKNTTDSTINLHSTWK